MSADSPKQLRTIIVDDEPLARRLLRAMLADVHEVEIVAECGNGREAIEQTRELLPDLLILDIQMPGMTGFDVVKALQVELVPNVIFCTAYQRYAIDARKIEQELRWRPRESFESGLRKTVRWYLDNREWWERVLDGSYRIERLGLGEEA